VTELRTVHGSARELCAAGLHTSSAILAAPAPTTPAPIKIHATPWQAAAAAHMTIARGRRKSTARAMEMERSTATMGWRFCDCSHGKGQEEEHHKDVDGACKLVLDVLGEEEDSSEVHAHRLFDRIPQKGVNSPSQRKCDSIQSKPYNQINMSIARLTQCKQPNNCELA